MELLKSPSTGRHFLKGDDGSMSEVEVFKSPSTGQVFYKQEGGELTEYSTDANLPSPPPESPTGALGDMTNSLTRGFTFGVGVPVQAAGGAVGNMISNVAQGEPAGDFGQHYDKNVESINQQDAAFKERSPYLAHGAEIAGMMANPITKGAGSFIGKGATMPARAARSALVGAPMGGVYAGATAPKGETAEAAGYGSVIGGALGAVSVPALEGALGLGRWGLQKVLDRYGGGVSAAMQKISKTIIDLGRGDMAAGLATMRQRLAEYGPDSVFADVLGEAGLRHARGAVNAVPKAAQVADDWVHSRAGGRGRRLHETADEIASGDFYPRLESIASGQRRSAKPLYDEAFAPVSDPAGRMYARWDDRLQSFLDNPTVREGMERGIKNQQTRALADDVPFSFEEYAVKGFDDAGNLIIDGTPNLRAMDAAKRGIDDILSEYRDKTTGKLVLDERGRSIEALRKALVEKLDDITTVNGRSAYKEARAAWAGPAQEMDAAWMGRRFFKGDEEVGKKTFDNLTPENQEMFLLGVRREITKMINTDTQSALTKFADKKADLWIRFKNILSPERFALFKHGIDNELRKGRHENFINPKANSATGGIKEDVAAFNRVPEAISEAVEATSRGGPVAAVANLGRRAVAKLGAPNEKTGRDLASMLLEMDPARQSAIIRQLSQRRMAQNVPGMHPFFARRLTGQIGASGGATGGRLHNDLLRRK